MSSASVFLEDIIDKCGGLGRFQGIIITIILGSKLSATWSMMMMTFAGAVPDWDCVYNTENGHFNGRPNTSVTDHFHGSDARNSSKLCHPTYNGSTGICHVYTFDNSMNTVVNEWRLVCDKSWVPSTITTIQMSGVLFGGLFAGHLGDMIGRKQTYFLSLVILCVFNVICALSVSWEMFAVCRFFIGLGIGSYITIYFTFTIEFIPTKHRPLLTAIPAWGMWSAVFGLISMWLHDWRDLHYVTAALTAPWLLCWWILPESFRWLVSNNKLNEAEDVIQKMARINRKPLPDTSKLNLILEKDVLEISRKMYSVRDLFNSRRLTKRTVLMVISWLSCGYAYYAISFDVQDLSGSLYLNMFLLSIAEVPGLLMIYFLANRLGRKWTSLLFCAIAGLAATIVGFIQVTDLSNKTYLSVFALASKLGVSVVWSVIMILATECFPTVIRTVSSGLFNAMARVGAMIAPQVLYVNDDFPGILFFLSAAVMLLTGICVCFLPETKNRAMPDRLEDVVSKKRITHFDNNVNITKTGKDPVLYVTRL